MILSKNLIQQQKWDPKNQTRSNQEFNGRRTLLKSTSKENILTYKKNCEGRFSRLTESTPSQLVFFFLQNPTPSSSFPTATTSSDEDDPPPETADQRRRPSLLHDHLPRPAHCPPPPPTGSGGPSPAGDERSPPAASAMRGNPPSRRLAQRVRQLLVSPAGCIRIKLLLTCCISVSLFLFAARSSSCLPWPRLRPPSGSRSSPRSVPSYTCLPLALPALRVHCPFGLIEIGFGGVFGGFGCAKASFFD